MSARKRSPLKKLRVNEINDQEIIDLLDGLPDVIRGEEDFRPYQRWMADFCIANEVAYLAAHMGLGKTGAVLFVIRRLLDLADVKKVLIVAPVNVANYTWPEEMRVWTFARGLTYSVLTGEADEREAAALEETEVHIINRENLVWLWRFWQAQGRWPYDMLAYDEASRLKQGNKRTKPSTRKDGSESKPTVSEFGALAKVRRFFKRVVEMSGTPAPNGLIDLWGPFYILDQGERLGQNKTAFKKRWFDEDKYTFAIKPKAHSEGEIMSAVSDIMIALRKEDYLPHLPPVVVNDKWVTLPPKALAQYRELEKTMVLEEHDIEAVTSGVLANKLLQLSNGSVYNEEKEAIPLHDEKLKALESIVEEAGGAPILIAYSFKFDLDRIKKRYPKFRVFGESKSDMRDWNAGRIPGLIVHPASAGHGMNFQYGGNIFVWYGLNWSLELYQQFNERLPRSGQAADRVFMHRILAKDTYDEIQLAALGDKGATQDSIMEAVRVRADDILRRQG
jgi:SNF2 family DNA or RNA helicase